MRLGAEGRELAAVVGMAAGVGRVAEAEVVGLVVELEGTPAAVVAGRKEVVGGTSQDSEAVVVEVRRSAAVVVAVGRHNRSSWMDRLVER